MIQDLPEVEAAKKEVSQLQEEFNTLSLKVAGKEKQLQLLQSTDGSSEDAFQQPKKRGRKANPSPTPVKVKSEPSATQTKSESTDFLL